jgi:tetratricopeptide (TPR) repeat protein
MRVFISHSEKDKPAVEPLAAALAARGIDVWLDKWEIGAGDSVIRRINDGLAEAGAGIIVYSRHAQESSFVNAELEYLTWEHIKGQKLLIPVRLDEDGYTPPPLLSRLAWRWIGDVDAIVDALLNRKPPSPAVSPPEHGRVERVLITLRRDGDAGIRTEVRIGGDVHGQAAVAAMPGALAAAQESFLKGFRIGPLRDHNGALRQSHEAEVAQLGRALAVLCFPEESGPAIAALIDGSGRLVGATVEVCWEADHPGLLGLPFEAVTLPNGRVLALEPNVTMLRRPLGLAGKATEALAGPLKILAVAAAPDEDVRAGFALDQEREVQNILDAVEGWTRAPGVPAGSRDRDRDNYEVRILEVAHPDVIGAAIAADAYHVLHLSCHGLPGALELEDEEGRAVRTAAEGLLTPIRKTGRPLPLVLLNACHTGVAPGQTASLAEALLHGGIPAVVAMQAPVSDHYAISLARSFYTHLLEGENFLPARALAAARKEEERRRLDAVQRGAPPEQTQPEFATAALYVAGEDRPIANFGLDRQPLKAPPVHEMAGQVPQLRIGDLIGRRRELRQALRLLRDPERTYAGVVLSGIGGAGKSTVAGRVMRRLKEDGWLVAVHQGRFDVAGIAAAIGVALLQSQSAASRQRGTLLVQANLEDRVRLPLLGQALAEEPLLLVLDDFEANLTTGGDRFLDDDTARYLRLLSQQAHRGRLLITCRHPVPGMDAYLRRIPVGPLSPAQTRKLLLRLKSLADSDPVTIATVLRVINGHPRALEFLDALLQGGGKARFPAVAEKLRDIAVREKLDLSAPPESLDDAMRTAAAVAAGDVLLEELLAIARREGFADILLQAAVSNLPMTPDGLARMLADDGGPGDVQPVHGAIRRLEALSLLHRFPDGVVWVHRWTAERLAGLDDDAARQARALRAGRYRWWRVGNESHDLGDAVEAVRNFLAAQAFDDATSVADTCFEALRDFQQSTGIAALASEVLETLPESHNRFGLVAQAEAQAHLALGLTGRALERWGQILRRYERLAQAEPGRADYQRDLSVSYNKMGDLFRALGQGEEARQAFAKSLAIRERLAQAEPGRADYQRDLIVSWVKMSDIEPARAREHLSRAHDIARSLRDQGRLAPADAWMVDELARRIGALP